VADRWAGGSVSAAAGSRPGVPVSWCRRRPSSTRRHQPGFGQACFGAVVCLCVL